MPEPDTSAPVADTPVDQAVADNDVTAYREARRSERTGTPAVVSAASTPAAPDVPAASTDASLSPASDPGTPAKPKNTAETRIKELLGETARLKADLDAARRLSTPIPDVTAASSPAQVSTPAKPSWATFEAQIGTQFETWAAAQDAYQDARDAWTDARVADQRAQERTQQDAQRVVQGFAEQMKTALATTPDFWDAIKPEVAALQPFGVAHAENPQTVRTPRHDVAEFVMTSEFAPQLLQHLSAHPDVFESLSRSESPLALYRAMGRLEASFVPSQASPIPQTRTVTTAPEPPLTLGRKSADPVEETDAAVAAGDMVRYRAARLAQRVAALR